MVVAVVVEPHKNTIVTLELTRAVGFFRSSSSSSSTSSSLLSLLVCSLLSSSLDVSDASFSSSRSTDFLAAADGRLFLRCSPSLLPDSETDTASPWASSSSSSSSSDADSSLDELLPLDDSSEHCHCTCSFTQPPMWRMRICFTDVFFVFFCLLRSPQKYQTTVLGDG